MYVDARTRRSSGAPRRSAPRGPRPRRSARDRSPLAVPPLSRRAWTRVRRATGYAGVGAASAGLEWSVRTPPAAREGRATLAALPVCTVHVYHPAMRADSMTTTHREPVDRALAPAHGLLKMVAVPHTDHGAPVERGRADELAVLYEIIHTVTSTLDLEARARRDRPARQRRDRRARDLRVPGGGGRPRIVLRAASEQYAHLCGRVSMGAGEGIAGWVLENRQPVFINEDVLSDPRVKYFPELEEEKYQSLVSVPLVLKGDRMIGVIALHAEAPRVFSSEDAAFLIHVASLVAHAIENARLYERTRRSLRELEHLSRARRRDRALRVDRRPAASSSVEVGRTLVRAESLGIYLVEASGDSLRLRAAARRRRRGARGRLAARPRHGAAPLGRARRRASRRCSPGTLWGAPAMRSALVAPLVAGEEVLGFLVARLADGRPRERARPRARELAREPDRRRPQAAAADRPPGRAQPHQGPLRRSRERHRRAGARRPRPPPRHRPRGAARRRLVRVRRDGARPPTTAEEQAFGARGRGARGGDRADRPGLAGRPPRGRAAHRSCRCAVSPSAALVERLETIVDELPHPRRCAASRASARARAPSRPAWPRPQQAALAVPVIRPARAATAATTSSGSTSTCCASRSTSRCATGAATRCARLRDHDRRRQSQLAAHARGVPAPARQHGRDREGPVRSPEYAAPAPAAHRRDHAASTRVQTTG